MARARSGMRALIVAVVVVAVVWAKAATDYYKLLGVSRSVGERELKRAYRKLSKEYHPDKTKNDPGLTAQFVEITKAYETLSDANLRRIYDQHGEQGVEQHKKGQQAGGGFGGFTDIFDLFTGGAGRRNQEERRGTDIELDLVVPLEDVYLGKNHEVLVHGQQLCPHCRGTGAETPEDFKTCTACNGQGVKIVKRMLAPGMYQQFQQTCDVCGGTGKKVKRVCHKCQGGKVVPGHKTIDVYVEKGVAENELLLFENEGDESPDMAAGHITFKVSSAPHPRFVREGNNLRHDAHISLLESLVGFKSTIEHLDGHLVEVSRDKVTRPLQVVKLNGEGLPQHDYPSKHGDLLVKFHIDFPTSLTDEQRTALDKILPK
ncbi:J domain-containing protein [Plasmodiophora brassicae]